jgi:hypothetical protein
VEAASAKMKETSAKIDNLDKEMERLEAALLHIKALLMRAEGRNPYPQGPLTSDKD